MFKGKPWPTFSWRNSKCLHYIVYEISKNNINNYPTIKNCLFGAVKLTKNTDIDKSRYSGYGIGFDRHGSFSFPDTGLGKYIIIFGVHMSSSTTIDNRKKHILILGKGPKQGLEHTLRDEKMYSIHFTEKNKKFCLSLHYKKEIVTYLLIAPKLLNLNQKTLKFFHVHYA